jgi:hypothetical protein
LELLPPSSFPGPISSHNFQLSDRRGWLICPYTLWDWVHLGFCVINRPTLPTPDNNSDQCGAAGGMRICKGNRNKKKKTWRQCHFVTTDLTWPVLRSKPGPLRWEAGHKLAYITNSVFFLENLARRLTWNLFLS